jgi:predicted dehydrogenase
MQKKTGKVLMIAHQRRFSPQAQYLKKIITEGKIGEIYHVRAYWVRRQGIPGMGGWFTQKEMSGGGALIDIGVHMLDLALWFMGHPEPIRVESSWGSRFGVHGKGASGYASVKKTMNSGFNVDDYVFAHVNYPRGVSLQLQCSWAGFIKSEESNIEIWGEKGGARLYPLEIFTEMDNVQVDITPKMNDNNQYEEEMRLFIEAVTNHLPSPYDPCEGLKVVELVNAIYANGKCDPEKSTSGEMSDKKQFEMV